jgi:hypothetical protein
MLWKVRVFEERLITFLSLADFVEHMVTFWVQECMQRIGELVDALGNLNFEPLMFCNPLSSPAVHMYCPRTLFPRSPVLTVLFLLSCSNCHVLAVLSRRSWCSDLALSCPVYPGLGYRYISAMQIVQSPSRFQNKRHWKSQDFKSRFGDRFRWWFHEKRDYTYEGKCWPLSNPKISYLFQVPFPREKWSSLHRKLTMDAT